MKTSRILGAVAAAVAAVGALSTASHAYDRPFLLYFAPVAGYVPFDHVQFNLYTPPANTYQTPGVELQTGSGWSVYNYSSTLAIADGPTPGAGYLAPNAFKITDPVDWGTGDFYVIADGFYQGQYIGSTYWDNYNAGNVQFTSSWLKSTSPVFVPEPTGLLALLSGGVGFFGMIRRKKA